MNPIFAMAGLAEAAFAYGLLLCWGGLIIIAILLLVSWLKPSWKAAAAAIALALALGYFLGPLPSLLAPKESHEILADSDYAYWLGRYRQMGWLFIGTIPIAVAGIPLNHRSHNSNAKGPLGPRGNFT